VPKRDGFRHGVPAWTDLSTTDEQAAKDFYAGLFGWQWTRIDAPGDAGAYWMASLQDALIAGLSQQQQPGAPSVWNTYINVDSADEATARATAAGAQVLMPPMDIADSGRMAFFRDPAGAPIGVWQPGMHKGAGLVNEPGAMIWNEVYAADTPAIVAFYTAVFGWESGGMPMPGGGMYTTFHVGEDRIGGTAPPASPQVPPHWQVWFGTADADKTAAKAAELGGTVVVQPTGSPVGNFAFLIDPTGAAFSVITPAP
jgi:predicted enzyme related to lactoylglutathione lyase